jgi:hypothetical protein
VQSSPLNLSHDTLIELGHVLIHIVHLPQPYPLSTLNTVHIRNTNIAQYIKSPTPNVDPQTYHLGIVRLQLSISPPLKPGTSQLSILDVFTALSREATGKSSVLED